jgi:acyl-coenzyme A thioesterase PaaI-like protein
MKILELIGVKKETLTLSENNQNHIGSMHAGAQFILAETASGVYLSKLFPELQDKIIPLMRESKIKYKKTAVGTITAYVSLASEEKKRFENQFLKKSKATIEVAVTLKNEDRDIVAISTFTWFIQKRE